MPFENLLDFADRYGLPLVLLFMLVKWIIPKIDQVWSKALGEPISQDVIDHLKISMDIDRRTNELLLEILSRFGCDWATVWQYHNGSISLAGMPFLRISATHQKAKEGHSVHAEAYQNLPTSLVFPPMIFGDCVCVIDHSNADSVGILNMMNSHDIAIIYFAPVYNSSGMVVAILTVAFDSKVVLEENNTDVLQRYANRIGNMLEVRSTIDRDSQPRQEYG